MQCLSRAPPRPQDKEKRTLSCRGHGFQGQGAVSSVPRRCVQGAVSKALCPRRGPTRCVQSALRCVSSVPQILSADFSIALSSVPQILSADFSIAFSSRSPSSCEGGRRHGRGQTQRKQEEAWRKPWCAPARRLGWQRSSSSAPQPSPPHGPRLFSSGYRFPSARPTRRPVSLVLGCPAARAVPPSLLWSAATAGRCSFAPRVPRRGAAGGSARGEVK